MFGNKRKEKIAEKRTVLFVDDDEIALQSLERGLLDESYHKYFTRSCKEALEINRQQEVHVVVSDMCMPEMTGLELIRNVRKERPDVIGMLLTGYEQDTELQNVVGQGEIFTLIPKPWKIGGTDFEPLLRRAIDHYNLQLTR
jgi:response regulator RpfG family c-di-GMP phosphodiesterase